MQQLLEVLQDQVRRQVDVNANQMLEFIGQLLQTVSALPVPAPLNSPRYVWVYAHEDTAKVKDYVWVDAYIRLTAVARYLEFAWI